MTGSGRDGSADAFVGDVACGPSDPAGPVTGGPRGSGRRAGVESPRSGPGGRDRAVSVIEVRGSAETPLPPDELFAFVADAEHNPSWQQGMVSCRWTTPGPIGVGSVYEQHARFLGRDVHSTFEVVEYDEGRRIRIRTTRSTIALDVTRAVEAVAPEETGAGLARSRVRAVVRGGPTGPAAVLDPVTRVLVGRSVRADYRRLEALLAHVGDDGA